MYEPLYEKEYNAEVYMGKEPVPKHVFLTEDVKSAVKGLIKYHEDNIERTIKILETQMFTEEEENEIFRWLNIEYISMKAIEHWLEDAL